MTTPFPEEEHYFWGHQCDGWNLLKSELLRVTRERMPHGTSEIMHLHRLAQQVFYVLSGTAGFEINGEMHRISAGKSVHIKPKTLHRIFNNQGEDLHFLVISEPDQSNDRYEIIDYNDELKEEIKKLNLEWLQKYFKVEAQDEFQLSNPKTEIIDKGGSIYFARFNNKICGTVSLMKINDTSYELGKMAVNPETQGLGIGQMLLDHCFHTAKNKGIKKIILYSNTKLDSAIHLYKKNRFYEVPMESGHYERANIKMERTNFNAD